MTSSRFSGFFVAAMAVLVAAVFALPATTYAQSTTSAIRIVVSEPSGAAASGVQVTIKHIPTGRTRTVSTGSNGVASTRGLAVGGPYEVAIAGGGSYAADVQQNIMVSLDQTEVIEFVARPVIEEVVVTAQAPTGQVAVGIGRSFDRARIDATPSVSRDFVSALATDPKILVDNSVARVLQYRLPAPIFDLTT